MRVAAHTEVQGLSLRPAVAEDALCLSVLAMQVFLDTYATQGIRPSIAREILSGYSEHAFARALASAKDRLVVAESVGHLVGFAHVVIEAHHELAPRGTQSELLRLYVQEPFTGRQAGSRLLAHAEQLAAQSGATVLWLTPWIHNHRALRFYARRGYADHGLTHFVFDGESHENRVLAKALFAGATPKAKHSMFEPTPTDAVDSRESITRGWVEPAPRPSHRPALGSCARP